MPHCSRCNYHRIRIRSQLQISEIAAAVILSSVQPIWCTGASPRRDNLLSSASFPVDCRAPFPEVTRQLKHLTNSVLFLPRTVQHAPVGGCGGDSGMSVSAPSTFLLNVTGQVEAGRFVGSDNLHFNYCFTAGQDWEVIAGLEECVSQTACRSDDEQQLFVWNFPMDITFKSTNPFGWPQIILSVYGTDFFGNIVIVGYTGCHVPLTPGSHTRRLTTFVPESASTVQKLMSWLTGRRPEFLTPQIIAQGRGREVTRVRSQGEITLTFNVMMKDFAKLGYDCGGSLKTPYLGATQPPSHTVTLPREGQSDA